MSTTAAYAMIRELDLPYEEADRRVREALQEEGFGVLTEIDVKATMKKKLDVDFARYEILGACNPPLAHKALTMAPDIGLLLPCNLVVRALDDGRTMVEALDPVLQLGVAGDDALTPVAQDVRARMERVLDRVAGG
ncbi:MAG TPA: DUF302 domain-containing protein [Longimicrobiales bacterium]|nr:DUF302 domain-containing protein [Longimicrobiales bacterium]